eukprot:6211413-Pleurochrysis_carterae.AAC.2
MTTLCVGLPLSSPSGAAHCSMSFSTCHETASNSQKRPRLHPSHLQTFRRSETAGPDTARPRRRTSSPSTSRPKPTCLPVSRLTSPSVTKNWEVFECLPELPIASSPRSFSFTCDGQGNSFMTDREIARRVVAAASRPRANGVHSESPCVGCALLEPGDVVFELLAPDGLAAAAVALDKITTLRDEALYDAVKRTVLVRHRHARLGALAAVAHHCGHAAPARVCAADMPGYRRPILSLNARE